MSAGPDLQQTLEYDFNEGICEKHLGNEGRTTSVVIHTNTIRVKAEVAKL